MTTGKKKRIDFVIGHFVVVTMPVVKDIHALIKDDVKNYSDEEIAIQAFEEMDANKDGLVTRDEFVEAVLDHKKFSQYLALKIFDMFS